MPVKLRIDRVDEQMVLVAFDMRTCRPVGKCLMLLQNQSCELLKGGGRKADSETGPCSTTLVSTTSNFHPYLFVVRTTFITTITPLTRADGFMLSSNGRHITALASRISLP